MNQPDDAITLGFEHMVGMEVKIKPTHILTGGTNGTGKSVLERALMSRVTKQMPFKIVIVDLKDPPDYSPYFPNIPVYISEYADPITIKRILETKNKMMLNFQFPELIKICRKRDTWKGVYEELCDMLDNQNKKGRRPLHPVREDKLVVLRELMGEFVEEMEQIQFATKVHIDNPVQVMKLTGMSVGLQQLIVRSVSEYILKNCHNTIFLIDEFHRIAPNGLVEGGAKDQIRTHAKEGRAKGDFIWASNQTLTSTDPEIRKQFQIWILGRQNDINEAKRVVDQTVQDIGINFKDVYRMKTGFFLVNDFINSRTMIVYVWPDGVTREAAHEVAMNRLNVEKVAAKLNEKLSQVNQILEGESDEKVYKEKFEEATAQLQKEREEWIAKDAKHSQEVLELRTRVSRLTAELEEIKNKPLRETGILPVDLSPGSYGRDAWHEVPDVPDFQIDHKPVTIDVEHREPIPRMFDTSNVKGQIVYVLSQEPKGTKLTVVDISTKAQEYGWNSDTRTWGARVSELVKEGSLFREGDGVRFPTKVEFFSKLLPPLEQEVTAK